MDLPEFNSVFEHGGTWTTFSIPDNKYVALTTFHCTSAGPRPPPCADVHGGDTLCHGSALHDYVLVPVPPPRNTVQQWRTKAPSPGSEVWAVVVSQDGSNSPKFLPYFVIEPFQDVSQFPLELEDMAGFDTSFLGARGSVALQTALSRHHPPGQQWESYH